MTAFGRYLLVASVLGLVSCGGGGEAWKSANDELIAKNSLPVRQRAMPATDVPVKLDAGQAYDSASLPAIAIAPGVSATLAWGKGALLEQLTMQKGAVYPEQTVTSELITLVQEGSAECLLDGRKLELTKDSLLYLTEGMKRTLTAGPAGLKAVEVYSPVFAAHLTLAGVSMPAGANVRFPDYGVKPSLEPGVVSNLNEVQLTPLTPPGENQTYRRSGANSQLVWGRNAMLSFIRMDPLSSFPLHVHPEEQLMITFRGQLDQGGVNRVDPMSGERRSVIYLPSNIVHSAKLSEFGADVLDVFWPVRPDYIEKRDQQQALYDHVVTPGTKPVKLAEGFTFSEGPTWLKGRLFFSDMFFKDHKHGDWTGSPAQSRTLVMEPDGKWKVLAQGMQTNGTIASRNGNLLVCDMFGHRVIEVDRSSGRVLRTVLDKVNGKPIDGPNDLVMDLKGGLYVTDPQFTPEKQKSQPGTQVYYVAPDGTAKVVIAAGEYAMPNGVEISPDGKTFYVNNTWKSPGENFVWAYDVQPDGSLANKRKFAMLNVTPEVLNAADPVQRVQSMADGMTVDMEGRLYVATQTGIQIFEKTGAYVGTIWFPQYPVSCTFGGPKGDVMYSVGESSAWSIQTRVKGFRHPPGMD